MNYTFRIEEVTVVETNRKEKGSSRDWVLSCAPDGGGYSTNTGV
jgi:hypothetical protein